MSRTGLILTPSGSVLIFADGAGRNLPQIGGAPELFDKLFLSGIVIGDTGSLKISNQSKLIIENNATLQRSGIDVIKATIVRPNTNPTTSLWTIEDWQSTGSFIEVRGLGIFAADHMLELRSPDNDIVPRGTRVRYWKGQHSSYNLMVSGAIGSISFNGNSKTAISSSSQNSAIELIYSETAKWIVLSSDGTWS